MPPPFAPTHSWVCPIWRWSHGRFSSPGATIFDSAHITIWGSTTMVYVANSGSSTIKTYVDCYLSNGTLEPGVRVSADVASLRRFEASLMPTRTPVMDAQGDFSDSGAGWFQLWTNGPVTPAALFVNIHSSPGSPMELVMPLEPVEIVAAVAEAAPPLVTREAAPEGVGAAGAETETLEANLSLPEAMAWFESVQSGRRFHRRHKKR